MSTDIKPTEPTAAPIPEADVEMEGGKDDFTKIAAARKQAEFYFGDSNLPFDKCMRTLHTADKEHWVPIKTNASFKRMRDFVSYGPEWLVDALRASEELELDESGEGVRRLTELQPPKGQFERLGPVLRPKGFGSEDSGLQKKLEESFNQYGQTNAVRMHRMDGNKEFKGFKFAEYTDIKGAEAFLNADPKLTWEGGELLTMSKEAYCDMKIKEKGLTGKAAQMCKDSVSSRKGFSAFREMEQEKNGDKPAGGKDRPKPEIYFEFLGSKIRVHEEDGAGVVKEEVPFVKGATLKFTGFGGDENFTEASLKERFAKVPFIKFEKGDDSGLVVLLLRYLETARQSQRLEDVCVSGDSDRRSVCGGVYAREVQAIHGKMTTKLLPIMGIC
ncbi:hypothetical protein CONPUDRAFT_166191 [Coniophora puteana RWD-64-598 SS2]|uniref:HTH La-type RNA-binding domain-containing protein n=1 Tax=Coniophora puteana (strain RWD-64-598) TaxID=741705 RepID=A0A5M3MNT3_CONPW|nr:uncharacterized protein CONPUDRAFT_166191 [Coniophora puteana RWD-64-598 SS2]EIW80773.1 hypothetical protein CONPUDRAFT_166191 [Coniophora puteana RWD-64-598 SS2]